MHLTVVDDVEDLIDPLDQDRRMRSVLVDMQLLMYGKAMKWEASVSSGKATGGSCPTRQWGSAPDEAEPLHLHWAAIYVMATPENREQVIADATDALVHARRGPMERPDGETPAQWRARIVKDGEGFDADHVAQVFNCLPRMVRRIRVDLKREPEFGRIVVPVDVLERRALVAQLVEVEGVSMRAAAMRLGVNYSTVLRDLGRKAA